MAAIILQTRQLQWLGLSYVKPKKLWSHTILYNDHIHSKLVSRVIDYTVQETQKKLKELLKKETSSASDNNVPHDTSDDNKSHDTADHSTSADTQQGIIL